MLNDHNLIYYKQTYRNFLGQEERKKDYVKLMKIRLKIFTKYYGYASPYNGYIRRIDVHSNHD